jgi:hypothetical protein
VLEKNLAVLDLEAHWANGRALSFNPSVRSPSRPAIVSTTRRNDSSILVSVSTSVVDLRNPCSARKDPPTTISFL